MRRLLFILGIATTVSLIYISDSLASHPIIFYSGTYYSSPHGLLLAATQSLASDQHIDNSFTQKHIISTLLDCNNRALRKWEIIRDDKTISPHDTVINLAFIISRTTEFTQSVDEYSRYEFMVGITMVLYSIAEAHSEKVDLYYTRYQLARKIEIRQSSSPLSEEQKKVSMVECFDKALEELITRGIEEYDPKLSGTGSPKLMATGTGATFLVDKFGLSKDCGFKSLFDSSEYTKQFIQWIHDGVARTRKVNLLPPFSLLGDEELHVLVNNIHNSKGSGIFDPSRSTSQEDKDRIVRRLTETAKPDYFIRAVFVKGDISTIKEIENRRANLYMAFLMGGVVKVEDTKTLLVKVKADAHIEGNRFDGTAYDAEDTQFMFDTIQKAALELGNTLANAIEHANLSI